MNTKGLLAATLFTTLATPAFAGWTERADASARSEPAVAQLSLDRPAAAIVSPERAMLCDSRRAIRRQFGGRMPGESAYVWWRRTH